MAQFELKTSHAIFILLVLLAFILLFQPAMFGSMIHTFLGRLTLLFISILITNYSSTLGLVWLLVIISLYEYYNRYEGFQSSVNPSIIQMPLIIDSSKPSTNIIEASDSVSNCTKLTPSLIPSDDKSNPTPSVNNGVDQATLAEKDRLAKGKVASQLPTNKSTTSSTTPEPVASSPKIIAKEGFALLEFSNF